jgi:hypothetical protein
LIGNSDATSNVFTNSRGMDVITPWTVSQPNDSEEFNFFDGTEQPSTAATTNSIPPGMLCRKTEFFPYEAFLSIAHNALLSTKDTQLTLTAPGTVDIFYRIPYDARKVISIAGALSTSTAGQTIVASITGTTQFANVSTFTNHEILGTYTTTAAGDQLFSFTPTLPQLFNNGAYFLRINLNTTASLSFRMITMNLRVQ